MSRATALKKTTAHLTSSSWKDWPVWVGSSLRRGGAADENRRPPDRWLSLCPIRLKLRAIFPPSFDVVVPEIITGCNQEVANISFCSRLLNLEQIWALNKVGNLKLGNAALYREINEKSL